MKPRFWTFFLALAVFAAAPVAAQAQSLVWDTGTAAGFQNGNGTWGVDNFWTGTGSGGTTLQAWNSANIAWFGGNGTVAASPSGNFTITVNGTQTALGVRQQSGTGNFTLTGGTLSLPEGALRVDQGTLTINSVLTNTGGSVYHLNAQANTTLILGGSNTFATTPQIRGGVGGTVRLNHVGALGTSSTVQFVNTSVNLDLNGLDISGKTITIDNGQTGFLTNTAATKAVWSGNVDLSVGTGALRAGGTGAELEISGIISGVNGVQSMDNGVLRLTGNNTYSGGNSVRTSSTLIVGHENALGAKTGTAFIGTTGTLDLNGFDVGSQPITLQQNSSTLVNNNTSTAANVDGAITLLRAGSARQIGGDGNLTLGGAIGSDANGGGFTKVGSGVLTLTGSNTYAGSTTVSAGSLAFDRVAALESSSGISIAAGTVLNYTGATTGTLSRNVTVSSSGTGTIRNSGGQKLTLSGTLTKDGRVLRLTGGVFDVTGRIVGTSANSDLLVDGTSTVTLSTTNSYVGPTFVNQASNLIVGINNAIPSNSVVTLGNATTTGTLSLGSFTNAIKQIVFSGSGGAVRMVANQTASPQLSSTSALTLGSNARLDLTGMATGAGNYRLISSTGITGTFGSVTGLDSNYLLRYGTVNTNEVSAQRKAEFGTITATPAAATIITGGSTAFTYTAANITPTGGTTLSFTSSNGSNVAGSSAGTAAASGTSASVSGLVFVGTTVGLAQTGSFTLADANAIGSPASGSVSVNVLDHANAQLALASGGGQTIITGGSFAAIGFNLTNAGVNRSPVQVDSLTNLIGGTGTSVVLSGGTASYTPASLPNPTLIGSGTLTVSMLAGDQQSLSGANALQTLTGSTTYTVLDHATSSLAGSLLTSTTISLGQWNYSSNVWDSGTSTGGFSIYNLASTFGSGLTADLSLTGVSGTANGFTTNLGGYTDLAGGSSSPYSIFFDTTGISTSGTRTATFQIQMSDKTGMSGAAATNTLFVTAQVIVVPEPGALALAAAGVGLAAAAWARRRT